MIDFDVAMQVSGEDEVVDDHGQCGTEGWMAPEVEEKLMYSPIKADRLSSGQVLFYLLDLCIEEESILRTIVRMLTALNPEQRTSMSLVVASFLDVVDVAV